MVKEIPHKKITYKNRLEGGNQGIIISKKYPGRLHGAGRAWKRDCTECTEVQTVPGVYVLLYLQYQSVNTTTLRVPGCMYFCTSGTSYKKT